MASVLVEWSGSALPDKCGMAALEAAGCSNLHRVHWEESFVAAQGQRQICRFRAPDAESVRLTLRRAGVTVDAVWTGTVLEGGEAAAGNVVIEREAVPPLPADAGDALAIIRKEWLAPLGFKLERAIVAGNRSRVIAFCEAPESVVDRLAAVQDSETEAVIWPCRRVAAAA